MAASQRNNQILTTNLQQFEIPAISGGIAYGLAARTKFNKNEK